MDSKGPVNHETWKKKNGREKRKKEIGVHVLPEGITTKRL